jgi:syntaxin 1B/2/3
LQHNAQHTAPPALHQQDSNYSQESSGQMTNVPHTDVPLQQAYQQQAYQAPPPAQHGSKTLTIPDFLSRVDGTKERIGQLTADIQSISTIHQRMLSSPDNSSSSELENIVTQTQIRNTQIKDEIQFLERDLSRPGQENAALKKTQINTVKNLFKTNLEAFQKEEHDYGERYRDAIARQYRIINPDATAAEVQEAANADWGNEGVFTQAVSIHARRIAF